MPHGPGNMSRCVSRRHVDDAQCHLAWRALGLTILGGGTPSGHTIHAHTHIRTHTHYTCTSTLWAQPACSSAKTGRAAAAEPCTWCRCDSTAGAVVSPLRCSTNSRDPPLQHHHSWLRPASLGLPKVVAATRPPSRRYGSTLHVVNGCTGVPSARAVAVLRQSFSPGQVLALKGKG